MVAGRNVDLIVCTIISYNLYRIICPSDWPHTETGTPESVVSQNQETKVRKSPHESVLVYSNKWAKTCISRYILQVFLITDNPKKQTNQFTISTNESGFGMSMCMVLKMGLLAMLGPAWERALCLCILVWSYTVLRGDARWKRNGVLGIQAGRNHISYERQYPVSWQASKPHLRMSRTQIA